MGLPISARPRLKPASSDARTKYKHQRSLERFAASATDTLVYSAYDPDDAGIMEAKPTVAIWRELEGRRGPLFGIELEIEDRFAGDDDDDETGRLDADRIGAIGDALKAFQGEYYLCHDGSLTQGVEIVFAPRSAAEWKARYVKLRRALTALAGARFACPSSCGLHIHVSREVTAVPGSDLPPLEGLTNAQAERLQQFVAVTNAATFRVLSRRSEFGFCRFQPATGDRYNAVNLTPPTTVELRFFGGTLNPADFFVSIETAIGLTAFFRQRRSRHALRDYVLFLKRAGLKHAHRAIMATPAIKERITQQAARAETANRDLPMSGNHDDRARALADTICRTLCYRHEPSSYVFTPGPRAPDEPCCAVDVRLSFGDGWPDDPSWAYPYNASGAFMAMLYFPFRAVINRSSSARGVPVLTVHRHGPGDYTFELRCDATLGAGHIAPVTFRDLVAADPNVTRRRARLALSEEHRRNPDAPFNPLPVAPAATLETDPVAATGAAPHSRVARAVLHWARNQPRDAQRPRRAPAQWIPLSPDEVERLPAFVTGVSQ